ncbi:centrosomal protein of 162 kDa-like [Patiria miniata]|uniref:Centrosomal protein of 162 kDa n=1 Tax=Patiria miniata TaxID=46514 RepID=A0A914A6R4_PATMI|nr:centrosomal protein of 162 kDa-like [Patiria miniata]
MRRAPKFSERDLDDDFEKFLKESLSDDSMDSDKLNKYFAKSRREEEKKKKKESQPWWMSEQDEDEDAVVMGTGEEDKTPTASKWLKPKKQSTPVTDKEEPSERKQKDSTKGYDGADSFKKKSHFSKDSLEDLSTVGKRDDKSSLPRERSGVLPSQASFEDTLSYTETGTSEGITPASTGPGMETLEEQADKERFFKELEAKRGGMVDYHRLIKEPDMSNTMGSLRSANLSNTMGSMPSAYMGTADEHSSPIPFKQLPGKGDSPHDDKHTDEHTDEQPSSAETSPSQPTVHPHGKMASPKKGMLAKVALLDTGDSMLNTTGQVGEATAKLGGGDGLTTGDMWTASAKNQMLDTSSGLLGAGTATEMEALQAALREAANTPTMDFSHTAVGTDEALDNGGRSRTVDDIIREVNAERGRMFDSVDGIPSRLMDQNETPESTNQRQRDASDEPDDPGSRRSELQPANESRGFDLQPANESRGFDLQPANGNRGFDLQPANESRGFDLQPANGNRGFDLQPANESRGFDLQPANESRGFDLQPANESRGFDLQPANESRGFDLQPANESRGFDLQPANESRGFHLQPATAPSGIRFDPSSVSADDENSQKRSLAKQTKRAIPKRAGTKPTSSRYAHIRGSGYGKPKPGDAWSPAETAKQKIKGSEVPSLQPGSGEVHGNIMASVESFAHYIQEHFVDAEKPSTPKERPIQPRKSADEPLLSASLRESRLELISRERALVNEVSEWQARWKEEHKLNAKLKAEIAAQQREVARKQEELQLNHKRELFKLKQDNTVLQAKLNIQDEQQNGKKRAVSGRSIEGASQEEIKLMQKEIVEQETLLQGYQQENERLYNEVRKLQKSNSEGEERLLRDNQKLQMEVANLREVLEQKDTALRHKGLITGTKIQQEIAAGNNPAVLGAGRIAELQVELREAEMREASLKQHLRQMDDANRELKEHIETLVRDKNHSQVKLQDLRDVKQREFLDMQQQYQHEIEGLNKKVRWYAENQEMLDKDASALREKNEEIKRLRETLEKANKQTNQKTSDAQRRAKERAADAKRIQDLERQVREMNDIIRRRHPNSLPALIYAAASAAHPDPAQDGTQDHARATPAKSHTVAFLEEKVRKMEAELDEKEAETKMFARVLEQKYNNMRFQYEDRLQALEKQLQESKQRHQEAMARTRAQPHAPPQKRELGSIPEEHQKKIEEMRAENEDLRRRLAKTVRVAWVDEEMQEGEQRGKGMDERSLQTKLTSLAKELSNRDNEIEMLKATCEKLMQERVNAMTTADSSQAKDKPQPGKKSKRSKSSSSSQSGEKRYQPENFSGTHISDVLTDNEQLKQQLEQLSLEMEQQRISSQASLAQSEGAIRRAHEEAAERLAALRANHAAEMEKLVAERALEHSDSRHAKLVGQLDTQQVMIKHLQEQLLDARVDTDSLSAARVREQLLKTQVEQLNEDLREAKKSHTPEMHHFEALQAKIATMEAKHAQREQELQQLVTRARYSASYEKDQEIAGHQQVLAAKNRELQQFRQELDAILEVLRELQRQGVVLPLHSHTVQSLLN